MVVWYNKRKSVYYTPPARNLSRVRIFLTLFGNAHAQLYQNPSDSWYNNEHLVNPSEAKDELSENIYPCGIITSKGSDERRRFSPPERQTRSLLRTLDHHSASVRPLACGSAAHFTFVKCDMWYNMNT